MYASQKVQVFSSLSRPETYFRHAQGHHRACSLTGSINIIQNTIFTVYEVESQNPVNAKLRKRTNCFAEVTEEIFHHNCRDSEIWKPKKNRNWSCIALLKLINWYYKTLWLKIQAFFKNRPESPSNKVSKNFDIVIKEKNWAIQTDFSSSTYSVNKTRQIPTKGSKKSVVVKLVLVSNCKRFPDAAKRENFILKAETKIKTSSNSWGDHIHQFIEVKEKP